MARGRVAVVSDSTAYLPQDVREQLDISVIPLNVIWGQEVLKDEVDIDPPAFYERLQSDPVAPKTSQPSAGEFVDFFRQSAEKADTDTLVAVLITSKLSGTIASAEAAKQMLPDLRIEVVDSLSVSMGLGFQAMAAAEAARDGASLEEIVEAAQRVRYSLQLLFMVDTLEYLHRGGRIGGGKKFLGTALKIKPILEFEDGEIEALEQVRTKKKALDRMLEISKERTGGKPVTRASVIHADVMDAALEFKKDVQAVLDPKEIYVCDLSPAIGTHGGPGTLGVTFYTS